MVPSYHIGGSVGPIDLGVMYHRNACNLKRQIRAADPVLGDLLGGSRIGDVIHKHTAAAIMVV